MPKPTLKGVGLLNYAILSSVGVLLASTYIVRTLLPFIVAELGSSEIEVSRVLYVGFIVLSLVSPVAGWLSDRFGAWRLLAISSLLIAILIPLYPLLGRVEEVIALRIMHAFMGTFCIASSLAIASWVSRRGGLGFGLLRFSQGVGIAIGPLLASYTARFGYEMAFLIAGAMALTPLISLASGVKPQRAPAPLKAIKKAFSILKACVTCRPLMVVAVSEVLGFTILLTYYTSYMVMKLGFKEIDYGTFLFLEAIGFSLGSYLSDYILRRNTFHSALLGSSILLTSYYSASHC